MSPCLGISPNAPSIHREAIESTVATAGKHVDREDLCQLDEQHGQ
jgi:hypothetical protein